MQEPEPESLARMGCGVLISARDVCMYVLVVGYVWAMNVGKVSVE